VLVDPLAVARTVRRLHGLPLRESIPGSAKTLNVARGPGFVNGRGREGDRLQGTGDSQPRPDTVRRTLSVSPSVTPRSFPGCPPGTGGGRITPDTRLRERETAESFACPLLSAEGRIRTVGADRSECRETSRQVSRSSFRVDAFRWPEVNRWTMWTRKKTLAEHLSCSHLGRPIVLTDHAARSGAAQEMRQPDDPGAGTHLLATSCAERVRHANPCEPPRPERRKMVRSLRAHSAGGPGCARGVQTEENPAATRLP
jgi:hypothetical protein